MDIQVDYFDDIPEVVKGMIYALKQEGYLTRKQMIKLISGGFKIGKTQVQKHQERAIKDDKFKSTRQNYGRNRILSQAEFLKSFKQVSEQNRYLTAEDFQRDQ
ncbi:hypothetical protein ABPG72_002103, partial [Tetrahymena utriculariae]